jgi:hypothetical protein
VSGKEDPLNQQQPAPRALYLGGENNEVARDNWWQAFQEYRGRQALHDEADRRTWDIAWAAAIAAHSYVWEGRLGPGR